MSCYMALEDFEYCCMDQFCGFMVFSIPSLVTMCCYRTWNYIILQNFSFCVQQKKEIFKYLKE